MFNFDIRRVARNTLEDETIQEPSGITHNAQPGILHESDAAIMAYIQGITPRSDAEDDAPAPLSGRLSERVHGLSSAAHQGEAFSVGTDLHTVDENKQGEPNPPKMTSMSSKRRGNRIGPGGKAISNRADHTGTAAEVRTDRLRAGAKASEDSEGDGYEGHDAIRAQDEDSGADKDDVHRVAVPKRFRKKSDRNSFSKAESDARDEHREKARPVASHQHVSAENSAGRSPFDTAVAPPAELASAESRPWSQTMVMRSTPSITVLISQHNPFICVCRLGEVEFMLRKPITCDADIQQTIISAEAGLLFMDEVLQFSFPDAIHP